MADRLDTDRWRLSEGDFLKLFLRHEPSLRAFARSLLSDWGLVDDALQEASVTMLQKLDQLRDVEGFLPWAKVILRFKCLSAIDAARRDRHVLSSEALELVAEEAAAIEPEELASLRDAMRVCLNQFSPAHQELLLAPYAGHGRVKQLAEQDRRTVNALYKLLGRLRARLASCVDGRLAIGGAA